MTTIVAQPFSQLGPQSPVEKRRIIWDFGATGWLAVGESIISAVVICTNPQVPNDPVAAAMVNGVSTVISATRGQQFIGPGGVIGSSYQATMTVQTSGGQVLSLTGNLSVALVLGVATS